MNNTNFMKVADSIKLKKDSNVLILGDYNIDFLKRVFKDTELNLYILSHKNSLEQLNLELNETNVNIKKVSDEIKKTDSPKIPYQSFSLILDFGYFAFAFKDRIYNQYENNYLDPEDFAYQELSKKENLLSSIKMGVISANDLDKKESQLIKKTDEEIKLEGFIRYYREHKSSIIKRNQRIRELEYSRDDKIHFNKMQPYLSKGGYYIALLDRTSLDRNFLNQITRKTDIEYLYIGDEDEGVISSFSEFYNTILLLKKREHNLRGQNMISPGISLVSSLFKKDLTNESIDEMIHNYESIKENFDVGTDFLHNYKILKHYLNLELKESYHPTSTVEDDVSYFRVGNVTYEELQEKNLFENVFKSYRNQEDLKVLKDEVYAPAPLHDGHIALLLTSGLINGYIGSGPNQHLIKGTTFKKTSEAEQKEPGEEVSTEYYDINLTILNANGEFKSII